MLAEKGRRVQSEDMEIEKQGSRRGMQIRDQRKRERKSERERGDRPIRVSDWVFGGRENGVTVTCTL